MGKKGRVKEFNDDEEFMFKGEYLNEKIES